MRLPWPGLAALAAMTAMAGMARASASSVCEGTRTAAKVADGALNVKVREDLAYVTGYLDNSFTIMNVSEPGSMRMVSNVTDARLQSPTEVALSGDLAFVALEMSTLAVVNISDPANPQVEGVVDAFNKYPYAYGIAASGEFAYVLSYDSATLIIINASDPTEPFICGTVTDKERLAGAGNLLVSGDLAYVASADLPGVAVVNVSDPTDPFILSSLRSEYLDGAYGVALGPEDLLYAVSFYAHAFVVVNISNPSQPFIVNALVDNFLLFGAYSVTVPGVRS
ncbi:unnamed protein product [Effrenium voratum]|nr:unnamed protein product [Effrenium voratum]